jgi:uncharacterized protein YceH (UPF0502 family)
VEPLSPVEARVVACLVEKQRTVPDTYPLTLNALVAACNQSSSRDPIMHLADGDVTRAIDSLKARGMARIVHPGAGSRSTKYRHVLDEALGIEADRLSVLAVLLLRGPQTLNELRTRTERLYDFDSSDDVETALEGLAAAGLAERRAGAREARWASLLCPSGHADVQEVDTTVTRTERATEAAAAPETRNDPGLGERVTALEAEVAELRSVVDRLRDLLD